MSDAVKSALRALMVIEILTRQPRGISFVDLCDRLDLPKSSAHGLLRTMVSRGHLVFDEAERSYRLGIRLWEAGQAYERGFDLPSLARPYMQAACGELGETVQMAVLDGVDNVYIAKVDADQRLVLMSEVGSRLPAYATGLGKALLSGLSDAEVRSRFDDAAFEAFTDATLTSLDDLLDEIDKIRRRGFSTDDGEYTVGVHCIAVPVCHLNRHVIAAMSVSVPSIRFGSERRQEILRVLREQAGRLSETLGMDRGQGHLA